VGFWATVRGQKVRGRPNSVGWCSPAPGTRLPSFVPIPGSYAAQLAFNHLPHGHRGSDVWVLILSEGPMWGVEFQGPSSCASVLLGPSKISRFPVGEMSKQCCLLLYISTALDSSVQRSLSTVQQEIIWTSILIIVVTATNSSYLQYVCFVFYDNVRCRVRAALRDATARVSLVQQVISCTTNKQQTRNIINRP
ncbi:hypothetical protein DNTS_031915, partial [Danionella cerebrum]